MLTRVLGRGGWPGVFFSGVLMLVCPLGLISLGVRKYMGCGCGL